MSQQRYRSSAWCPQEMQISLSWDSEGLLREEGKVAEPEIYIQVRRLPAILYLCVRCSNYWFIFLECKTVPTEGGLFLNQYKQMNKQMKPLLCQSWNLLAICHLLKRWGGKACSHWAVVPLKAFPSVTSRQCSAPRSPAQSGPCCSWSRYSDPIMPDDPLGPFYFSH